MGEQYTHTLIPKQRGFSPAVLCVQEFLLELQKREVVPGNIEISLRIPTGKMREFPNLPPAMQGMQVEIRDRKKLQSLDQLTDTANSLQNYEIAISGFGRPKLPPLKIDFSDSYHVGITCRSYSAYRSTSNPHEVGESEEEPVRYGRVCPESQTVGLFTNPHNGERVTVQGAGSARFWIQFELGKFLLPEIPNNNLEIIEPSILNLAKGIFGLDFLQGCLW